MSDFTGFVDLASERLGSKVIEANDEFFGAKGNLLKVYGPAGPNGTPQPRQKGVDGWMTRRRRTPGCDWCVIRLGLPGIIRGVVVDTSFFKGDHPTHCSVEASEVNGVPPYTNEKKQLKDPKVRWVELLPRTPIEGDTRNEFPVEHSGRFTHLRLKIYPDGGVARLRVHGEGVPDKKQIARAEIDLATAACGGRVVASSDSSPAAQNLLLPGSARDAGDGWITPRRRGPGHDWVMIKLGVPGVAQRIEIDTSHFKGDSPESCSVEACYAGELLRSAPALASAAWSPLLVQTRLQPGRVNVFRERIQNAGAATHVRLNIFPDGGVARLRIWGRAERPADRLRGLELLNHLPKGQVQKVLLDCCGSKKWVEEMIAQMPFSSPAHLFEAASRTWAGLDRKDWRQALRLASSVGTSSTRKTKKKGGHSAQKAKGTGASPELLEVLAAAKQAYQATFGYPFVNCAAGMTTEEIVQDLRLRLSNDPEVEMQVAGEERRKITHILLEKLLQSLE